ncbi:hypothetical protein FOVG_03332 [Fusarium oxysporum f. sp. pisi HDV247]|uniref:Uncharacterized protein n=1 Tax=Fusarium oxysporum f. sp. pisi HDV247 TaxID=1080344 RepID=W9Q850_FUSOX|nr:hypothetical protein FOVG_03332 [Fusarium oxysporum f. sp. pisi HDV247]
MAPQDPGYQTPALRQAASGLWVIVDELQNAARHTRQSLKTGCISARELSTRVREPAKG